MRCKAPNPYEAPGCQGVNFTFVDLSEINPSQENRTREVLGSA